MISFASHQLNRLAEACNRHRVKSLWLFGSATDAEVFDPSQSDLDFLVEFYPHKRGAFDDVYFLLKDDLEAIFDRPVDLVEVGAIENPYFREAVLRHRVPLYAAA